MWGRVFIGDRRFAVYIHLGKQSYAGSGVCVHLSRQVQVRGAVYAHLKIEVYVHRRIQDVLVCWRGSSGVLFFVLSVVLFALYWIIEFLLVLLAA